MQYVLYHSTFTFGQVVILQILIIIYDCILYTVGVGWREIDNMVQMKVCRCRLERNRQHGTDESMYVCTQENYGYVGTV